MKANPIRKLDKTEQRALNNEVRRQMLLVAENMGATYDAIVLLCLYKTAGYRKRRLRRFYEEYGKLEQEMQTYFQTAPLSDMKGVHEMEFYAVEELRRAGVDIKKWRELRDEWDPEKDECWRACK